jgi:hypothetical protein
MPFDWRAGISYFEVEIIDMGQMSAIGVGLVPEDHPLDRLPGWEPGYVRSTSPPSSLFLYLL